METIEKASLYHLYLLTGFSSKRLQVIKRHFGSFHSAWQAPAGDWLAVMPDHHIVDAVMDAKKRIDILAAAEKMSQESWRMMTLDDESYPGLLRRIYQAPYILFYKGNPDIMNNLSIAVVGSRRATAYGRIIARQLARELSEAGVAVVSGMARGIDSEAHWGALEGAGYTAAVLGSGIDVVYPRENRTLYERICERGAVISEFCPGTPPEAANFPRRNRIISGLSKGVAVVEAKMKSGALITADFALEQGRDVFAVPGPVTSEFSAGTNHLIQQGAKLITCAGEVLEEYSALPYPDLYSAERPSVPALDRNEQEILKYISYDPMHMDEIVISSGMEIGLLSTVLLGLELAGLIVSLPGNYYTRV